MPDGASDGSVDFEQKHSDDAGIDSDVNDLFDDDSQGIKGASDEDDAGSEHEKKSDLSEGAKRMQEALRNEQK